MAKMLTKLRIREVSSVDRGAGEGVKIMLMKRDDDDDLEYWKREFSSADRKRDAKSGAAESDGSFPIHNATDLHNAMRAIGRSKNPSKTRAHIRARAAALGLTGQLSDSFKRDTMPSKLSKIFNKIFGGTDDDNATIIDKSVDGLAESVTSILGSDVDDVEKVEALTKTFEQFGDHLKSTLTAGSAVDKKESDMDIKILAKALGLADNATEADVSAALAKNLVTTATLTQSVAKLSKELEISKADYTEAEVEYLRKASMYDEEEDDTDPKLSASDKERKGRKKAFRLATHEERAKIMKKSEPEVPEYVTKILGEMETLRKQNAELMTKISSTDFMKRATEVGLGEGKADTIAKAYAGDKSAVDELLTIIKSATEAARAGKVFSEFGSSVGKAGDTPLDQLNAKAAELRKSDPKLSEAQAFAKVYEDPANSELVRAERAANRPVAA